MANKKNLLAVIGVIVILIIGIAAGIYLIRRQQKKIQASVTGGQATIAITPQTGTYQVGDNITTNISFNSAGIPISGIAVRLKYFYSGNIPELYASNLNINPTLLSAGDWSCPVKKIDVATTEVSIDISCVNFSSSGFTSTQDTNLASFEIKANKIPTTNPTSISFDAQKSVITRKSDGEDVLLIPESMASYTITGSDGGLGGGSATITPSPTATATSSATITPSPTAKTSTPNATTSADLPETGFSLPTLLGIITGSALLIVSLYLAF
jgi:hypothetical protein